MNSTIITVIRDYGFRKVFSPLWEKEVLTEDMSVELKHQWSIR